MPAYRIIIMLKPGVLDAAGQAIERGLAALDYDVGRVRAGKVIEITVAESMRVRLDEMCERFLANPLIETWQIEEVEPPAGGPDDGSEGGRGRGAVPVATGGEAAP